MAKKILKNKNSEGGPDSISEVIKSTGGAEYSPKDSQWLMTTQCDTGCTSSQWENKALLSKITLYNFLSIWKGAKLYPASYYI